MRFPSYSSWLLANGWTESADEGWWLPPPPAKRGKRVYEHTYEHKQYRLTDAVLALASVKKIKLEDLSRVVLGV